MSILDTSEVRTLQDLAGVLRALRRRHARRHQGGELTYRELATRTGWSTAAIAEYLTGKTLPPTDRFDVLVGLFGATRAEQGALATLRDRVAEEHRRASPKPSAPKPPVPRQLPADVFAFTGRGDQLAHLDALLADRAEAVVITAVSGTAGVGKTALAVHWAHRAGDRFPDGQLYVNLRGYDPEQPMPPGDALTRFLVALGVAGGDIALDVEDRAAQFRTQVAGRRMLVVLDNAATVEQVRPLLPGTPACAVLVTSRDSLAGLVAREGARRVILDLMPLPDAITLLRQLIGSRAEAEREAVSRLAELCARLPLALRVAAERVVSHPDTPVADLTAELADRRGRLELMDAGGDPRAAVTAVLSWSVQQLPSPAARTFRLIGLHPGADLDAYAVASLAATDVVTARRDMEVLARAHLVHYTAPGRYGMHDLLHAYATRLSTVEDSENRRRAAQGRLFDFYLATARLAINLLHPDVDHRPRVPAGEVLPADIAGPEAALEWLDTERGNLIAVSADATTAGWPAHAIDLATTLCRYLDGGHHIDSLAIYTNAHRASELTGDLAGQAQALVDIGCTHLRLSQQRSAADYLRRSLDLFHQAGDYSGQSHALTSLGKLELRRRDHDAAVGYLEQALALARRAGNHNAQARTLTDLSRVETQRGRAEIALGHLESALALVEKSGSRFGRAGVLCNLGMVEYQLARHDAAADHLQQSLVLFGQLGHRYGEAHTLDGLGQVHLGFGRPGEAVGYLTASLETYRETGGLEGQASALNGLGEAAGAMGRPGDALTHHHDALSIATDIGSQAAQARAHTGLGRAYEALGDPGAARHHLDAADHIGKKLGALHGGD